MKITKYPQSCLLIETDNRHILVDAGSLKYKDEYLDAWKKADLILLTHKHGDHVNADVLKNLNISIYSTLEVDKTYPELNVNVIKNGDEFNLDNIKIEVVHAIHGYNPLLKGGKEISENVGYIIDDGNVRLYITSDTICFNHDYKADVIACPVTAHGLTMSSYEASLLAKEIGTKLVLPVHMDNPLYPTDIEYLEKNFKNVDIEYKILEIEESIEV